MMKIDTSLVGEYGYFYSSDDAWDSGDIVKDKDGKPVMDVHGHPVPDKKRKKFLALWLDAALTGDYSAVPRHEGREPIRWTLQHIGSRHIRAVQQEVDAFNAGKADDRKSVPWLAMYKAARMGIVGVTGLFAGEEPFVIERDRDSDLSTLCVTHGSMDTISRIQDAAGKQIGNDLINEIGMHVVRGGSPAGKS